MSSSLLVTLEIPRHLNDQRVDAALTTLIQEKFPDESPLSRAFLTRSLNDGVILLNDEPVLARTLVVTHDRVTFPRDIFEKKTVLEPLKGKLDLEVLSENEHFLILNKGPGVQMHQGGHYDGGTVAAWLVTHYPDLVTVGEDPLRPGIVHRLDRDTSGALVVARDGETFTELKNAFQKREIAKTYIALVYGHLSNLEGEVAASLIRKPGELRRRAIDTETYTGTLPGNARSAFTSYRVIARYEEYDLVELSPKTGRTHQLRVHLSFLGHPVVGDSLYAFKEVKRKNLLVPERQLLHAAKLAFSLHGSSYEFTAPLAEDFRNVLKSLDETLEASYDDEALKSLF